MPFILPVLVVLFASYCAYAVLSGHNSRSNKSIPLAHPLSSWTDLWILYRRWLGRENSTIWHAHKQLGPIVRLGPSEVSVNSLEGLEAIYTGNFDKHDFYSGFEQFGETNMFSELGQAPHLEKRKMLNTVYSKSYIMGSPEMRAILYEVIHGRMLTKLREYARSGNTVEVFSFFSSTAMDMVSSWVFGQGSGTDFLNDSPEREQWQGSAKKLEPYFFYWLYMNKVVDFFDRLHLPFLPNWTIAEAEKQPAICLSLCRNSARRPLLSPPATVFSKLATSLTPTPSSLTFTSPHSLSPPEKRLAAEVLDHLLAGSDTTATTLLYLFHHLSLRPALQSLLRTHLSTLPRPSISTDPPELSPTFLRALDSLPLLDALITESLRLNPPVPGSQPRLVPPRGVTLHSHPIAPGTRISCSAYALHRNPHVFSQPEEWAYERWLDASEEEQRVMRRWFWGWGGGVRMCVGKAFAVLEMKVVVAVVFGESGGMGGMGWRDTDSIGWLLVVP
ncbi:cytochrome P450 [Elsinoe ampelina]|uniref:Cytochrome P450 n=1 Tax=Elsinoe ampelina TaxID=302913 RepID=A0A6A6G9X7_9PEZI|nr:cytochrome P450 [Elsinoe ampelina]